MSGAVAAVTRGAGVSSGGYTAEASPETAYGTGGGGLVVSEAVTCTPTGGVAPYSYLWEQINGDTMAINSPTSASTTFQSNVMVLEPKNATFACTVTDAASVVVISNTVAVVLEAF